MMKILVTIGPVSSDPVSIQKFAKKTKLFRLNGSHGSIEWHKNVIDTIRKACPDAFILMDIPGVKPRTNNQGRNIDLQRSGGYFWRLSRK